MAYLKVQITTTILIEADQPEHVENMLSGMSLSRIDRMMDDGDAVGSSEIGKAILVPDDRIVDELEEIGSDASFFGIEEPVRSATRSDETEPRDMLANAIIQFEVRCLQGEDASQKAKSSLEEIVESSDLFGFGHLGPLVMTDVYHNGSSVHVASAIVGFRILVEDDDEPMPIASARLAWEVKKLHLQSTSAVCMVEDDQKQS